MAKRRITKKEPNQDLTEIIIISDRSGSMYGWEAKCEDGINSFVREQVNSDGKARITLYEFDDRIDKVFSGTFERGDEAPEYRLHPRNATALCDAVGHAITETRKRNTKNGYSRRPANTVVLVATDGHENASETWGYPGYQNHWGRRPRKNLPELIAKCQEEGWNFIFIGANIDALGVGKELNLEAATTANFTMKNIDKAFKMSSKKIGTTRSAAKRGAFKGMDTAGKYAATQQILSYSADDRKELTK